MSPEAHVVVIEPQHLGDRSPVSLARREIGAIMATNELTTDLLQRALRAGVKDVLQLPVESTALEETVLLPTAPMPIFVSED